MGGQGRLGPLGRLQPRLGVRSPIQRHHDVGQLGGIPVEGGRRLPDRAGLGELGSEPGDHAQLLGPLSREQVADTAVALPVVQV